MVTVGVMNNKREIHGELRIMIKEQYQKKPPQLIIELSN